MLLKFPLSSADFKVFSINLSREIGYFASFDYPPDNIAVILICLIAYKI
jgi:hypothetical protein